MTLGEKQRVFTLATAHLIIKAYELGYEGTHGDTYRDPRVFGAHGVKLGYGRGRSLHKLRLAYDLNLFRDGVYLTSTEDHKPLGEWWEAEYAQYDASWGGHFNDGNHYSFRHNGDR